MCQVAYKLTLSLSLNFPGSARDQSTWIYNSLQAVEDELAGSVPAALQEQFADGKLVKR